MTARYNTRLNFTFTSLRAAQRGLQRLRNRIWRWTIEAEEAPDAAQSNGAAIEQWTARFFDTVNANLDLPGALALTWKLARADLPNKTKLDLIETFDEVLGLDLMSVGDDYEPDPEALDQLLQRAILRDSGDYSAADRIRSNLEEDGYVVEDHRRGSYIRPRAEWQKMVQGRDVVSAAAEVPSLVFERDGHDLTIGIVACNYTGDVERALGSALKWAGDCDVEAIVLDNGSDDGASDWLDDAARSDSRIRVIHADHRLGEAAAKNIVLKQSLGRTVVLIDTSVEIAGDIYGPIDCILDDDKIGVVGPFGLRTDNLHHFHDGEDESGEMDAMQAYCFAFRRKNLREVGLMRESFRFYRNLDIDYSFHFKDKGKRSWPTTPLPSSSTNIAYGTSWPKESGTSSASRTTAASSTSGATAPTFL